MRFLLLTFLFSVSLSAFSQTENSNANDPGGWFWYEDPVPEPEPEKEPKIVHQPSTSSAKPESSEEVVLNSAWLRKNLPNLLEKAQDNPTKANIANYFYAQRLAIDMASRFAEKSQEFALFETALSEKNRRPSSSFALAEHKNVTRDETRALLNRIFSEVGFWFFYRSDCPYCKKQLPSLTMYKQYYGADILGISMDGQLLSGDKILEHSVDVDLKMSTQFDIQVTPTIVVVKKDGSEFHKASEGMLSTKDLTDRLLIIARDMDLITEDEFNYTRDVRRIMIVNSEDDQIHLNKARLDSDPEYLSEALRKKLEGKPIGTAINAPKQ